MICPRFLGVFGHCETIDTGLTAPETGVYVFTFRTPSGYSQTQKTMYAGESLVFEKGNFNEAGQVLMSVKRPFGSQLPWITADGTEVESDLFSFEIRIYNYFE
jgi:hypothetical protein